MWLVNRNLLPSGADTNPVRRTSSRTLFKAGLPRAGDEDVTTGSHGLVTSLGCT